MSAKRRNQEIRKIIDEHNKEMELAKKRLGGTPEERLSWVIQFSQKDLDLLRPEELVALGYDLGALSQWGIRQSHLNISIIAPAGPMKKSDLLEIQTVLKNSFKDLFSEGKNVTTFPEGRLYLWRSRPENVTETQFHIQWQGIGKDAIIGSVFALVLEAGRKLRGCVECGNVFVARKRQIYCTGACSQKARDKRKRDNKEWKQKRSRMRQRND